MGGGCVGGWWVVGGGGWWGGGWWVVGGGWWWVGGDSILKSLISTCVLSYIGSREDWLLDRICES